MNSHELKNFISKHDMLWEDLPTDWDEGPFLGNGCTGALLWYDKEMECFTIKPGRTDIYDNRPIERYTIMDKQFAVPRLQLGPIHILTKGKVKGCNMRLSLYDAILTGEFFTDCGKISINMFIPSGEEGIVLSLVPSENEEVSLKHIPMPAESPRQTRMVQNNDSRMRKDYARPKDALPPVKQGDTTIYEQPLFTSGSYCVAINEKGNDYIIALSVSDDDGEAIFDALKTIKALENKERALISHKEKRNEIYGRSFFSVSDPIWEKYWWIQIYKMACLTREGGRIVDTMGPWAMTTSWPSAFWNLNVQLTYAPMIPTGMFDISRSLPECLYREKENLNLNIAEEYRDGCFGIGTNTCRNLRSEVAVPGKTSEKHFKIELGNLTWALHVCYTLYKTTLDEEMLKSTILPLLEGSVKYYCRFLFEDEKGILHLAPTESPEYLVVDEDTNYDLALLKWGLGILIDENSRLDQNCDKIAYWQNIRSRLTTFPKDENEGLLIARNTHLAVSHRHYSHLLAFYPLHLLDADKKEDSDLVKKSVEHWQSMPEVLEGYSMTGAASMCAMLRDGDKAIEYLDRLMRDYIRPSTLYREEGGPVTETPLAAISSISDMLLQSYGGKIRVFPACPTRWKDAKFTLFAEGGIKVTAERKNGALQYVKLRSMINQNIKLYADFDAPITANVPFEFSNGLFTFDAKANEEIEFSALNS